MNQVIGEGNSLIVLIIFSNGIYVLIKCLNVKNNDISIDITTSLTFLKNCFLAKSKK